MVAVNQDYQYSFNNFTFGEGSDFWVTVIDGLDPVDSRVDINERPEDHGAYVYAGWNEVRKVVFQGDLYAVGSYFANAVNTFRQAFASRRGLVPLYFKLPYETEKCVFVLPVKRSFNMDIPYSNGHLKWAVQFVAEDPRIYGADLITTTIGPTTPAGGIDFSVDFDTTFGGTTGGQAAIINSGVANSPAVMRINGPASYPRIVNLTTGERTLIQGDVAAGDYLEIDYGLKTVILNGTTSRFHLLQQPHNWWLLEPGTQYIQFAASGTTGASSLVIKHRSAWW